MGVEARARGTGRHGKYDACTCADSTRWRKEADGFLACS